MTPTDSNFEFLAEYITAKVVEWIMYDKDMGLEAALLSFHNSETFDLLCRRSTGMYVESPAYVYDVYNEEMRSGTVRNISD